jgi:tetratricopeptide (TPR) repeat protein
MKRLSGILILVLTCFAAAKALPATDQMVQRAQALYQQKQYDSAAYYYEQLLARAPATASLYYNLGNAYYKSNKVGLAVLNYERALFYDPSNKDAADNLQLTQSRITNRIQEPKDVFFVRWWNALSRGDHATGWAIVSLVVFLMIIGALFMQRSGKLPIQLSAQVYFAAFFALVFCMLVAYTSADKSAHSNKAVVMANNTPFSDAPGKGKSQSLIPEGVTVETAEAAQDWIAVTLPDGRRGWIQRSWLTPVQLQRP